LSYSKLIADLKKELASKQSPGPVLDQLMFARLDIFAQRYEHNHELLLLGAVLSDIRIDEAKVTGDIGRHIELALQYAEEIFEANKITESEQEIVREVIATHHGGAQKYIESKIFKNADNFKFLEPKGCLEYFSMVYERKDLANFDEALATVKHKLKEKLDLTDLDEEAISEAKMLYDFNTFFLDKCVTSVPTVSPRST
jgi:hypothetical protein